MNICAVVDNNTKKFQDILGDNAAAVNAVAWANKNFDGATVDARVNNALKFISKMKNAYPKGERSADNYIKELHSKKLVEKITTIGGGAHYKVSDHTRLVWYLVSDKSSSIFAGYNNISDNSEAPKYNYIHAKKKYKINANHAVNFDEGFKESVKSVGEGMLGYALMSIDGIVSNERVNQSVSVIAERVAREVISGKDMSKADVDNIINSMYVHFKKIRAAYEAKGSAGGVAHMDSYLNNWGNFKSMVYNYLQKRSGLSFKEGVANTKAKESAIIDENEIVENNPDIDLDGGDKSQGNFSDNFSITLDSKVGLSGKLKLFLSTIKDGNKHYLTGEQLFKNFDEAYNTLSSMLANTEPDIHLMINQLKDYVDGSNETVWIQNLIDKLNEAKALDANGIPTNMSLVKQFVTAMNKHYIDMSFVQWVNSYAGTEMSTMGDNANSRERVVRANWVQEIELSGLINIDVNGRRFYNREHAKNALAAFDELIANPTEDGFFDAFNNIGIRLSKRTISELFKGNYKNGRYAFPVKNGLPANIFSTTEASSPVSNIYKILKSIADSDKPQSTDDNTLDMMRQGSIQSLSKLEAKYARQLASNSHNSGNKTVYSYTNDKFIADRMYELVRGYKTGDGSHYKILRELQNDVFAKNSRWLRQLSRAMKDNPTPEDLAFIDNFEFGYLSLNPIKKKDGKSDDRGLQDMSPQEIIAIKLGLFANNAETVGKGLRVSKMFYPTMSDKTNMMLIKSILLNGITYDGTTVNSDTINEIYDSVVMAEINRMNAVRTSTSDYKTSTGIDGYDNGSRLFYTIPELNALPQIFERTESGVRVLKYEADLTDDDISAIKAKIASSLNNMIRRQIDEFADTKIGYVEGESALRFMDIRHVNYIKSLYPGAKMTNKQVSDAIAADFAINYFLHNMNVAQMLHGDYALYYTDKSKSVQNLDTNYETKVENMSSEEVYDVVKATFDNLGKRLAADLAPGYEADFGDKTTLRVTTSSDRKMRSLAIDYIEKVFNVTQDDQTKEDKDAVDA